jgi:pimeloyl-ACP methyl ester carboxylesterase
VPDADQPFFVSATGHRLRALRIGRPGAGEPVLVFLHEGLGSIPQWRGFPRALCAATGYAGLVYERRGYGGSDPVMLPRPADFLDIEAREALPEILDACGIERPILIGHSDGGTIALLFAAAFPDRPVACVTEAAHVVRDEVTLAGLQEVARRWRETDLRTRLARHHGANTEAMFRGWSETWLRPEMGRWSIVDRLPSIVCPVLAIQGERDEHGSPAQLDAIVEGVTGPAERYLVPHCGHAPHHEAHGPVLERVRAFIERVAPRAQGVAPPPGRRSRSRSPRP